MTPLPAALHEHLSADSLSEMWLAVRARLERNGLTPSGVLVLQLDDDGADRLGGVLGRAIGPGQVRVRLAELDASLRGGAAARGLAAVTAEVTGSPLTDRRADGARRDDAWAAVWRALDDDLVAAELAAHSWTTDWVRWLRTSGVVRRLGIEGATIRLRAAVAVIVELGLATDAEIPTARPIGVLASRTTGSAHGLDDGRTVAALALRAAALALEVDPPESSAARRELWRRVGIETDLVSGTVLVWGLRPPGADPWSQMMNARADLGLVTHLTERELRSLDVSFAAPGTVVHGCENPQVLQALADAGVSAPVLCVFGNPSTAGLRLISSVPVHYHGDFDWPGIAITGRLLAAGAQPWRMASADYLAALGSVLADARLPLSGVPQPTPWDPPLTDLMRTHDTAVHEEALIATLLTDLR